MYTHSIDIVAARLRLRTWSSHSANLYEYVYYNLVARMLD